MAISYPAVGFHFQVNFDIAGTSDTDTRFQDVSGISSELQLKEVREGGENRFIHKLPVRTSYPILVLKRGLFTDSGIINWARKAIENLDIEPITVVVSLLSESHEPLHTYAFYNCWPKKWEVSGFKAQDNSVVVETMELAYQYFKVEASPKAP